MTLAFVLALLSGALCAVLVCKAIKLKLWLDGLAAIGGALAMLAAARLSGAEQWPLWGWPGGFLAVAVALKLRQQRS